MNQKQTDGFTELAFSAQEIIDICPDEVGRLEEKRKVNIMAGFR